MQGVLYANPGEWQDYLQLNLGYLGEYQRYTQNEGGLSVTGSITSQQLMTYALIGVVAYLVLRG